jgi:acetyl-CoA/propionyl-CoA carboxylase biotin carboxyl carrier protein
VIAVEVDGRRFDVRVFEPEPPWAEVARNRRGRGSAHGRSGQARGVVTSPMQGTVLDVRVEDGQTVVAGDVLCIVEAMKMENEIAALEDGIVTTLAVTKGQAITADHVICVIAPSGEEA